ncbi:MAG TPA: acylase [Blastocatellia bacterium]|nr:acylase [Blastocatellia bacterium]HMX27891.1 acylase [Blastocatellia bacterium]HMZ16529.1 acylase [Blastocatellia bacterium]HNG33453.1 acylase [Blastocatellia bacterium]
MRTGFFHRVWLASLSVMLTAMLLTNVSFSQSQYSVEIRRTSHGIPHITAKDYGSLGFGEGYAFAQDHLCSLADQVIKVRGERAKYFGAGENNRHLNSDLTFRAFGLYDQVREMLKTMDADQRAMVEGYVAGYNQYLREVTAKGVKGWCSGKDWVLPITTEDLMAYQQSVVVTTTNLAEMIATAMPPKNETAFAAPTCFPEFDFASNGWAIGSERSAGGRGMLIANPHYPWIGSNRFWEKHLVIPGKLDVYGVGLLGSPGVAIGFNRNVAWTHTVSAGKRFTMYTLDLVPGNPTQYLYDGKPREMTSKAISVSVKQADGSLKQVERRIFFSHYGPIINFPGVGWTAKRAVTVRDANLNNTGFQTQRMAMNRARSLEEFKKAHADFNALPWVNTIATSADGRAWYADTSATPNLKPEAIAALLKRKDSEMMTKTAWDRGIILLDGSNSLNEWVSDPTTRAGVIPWSRMPQLERKDYVFNANDSFWLANPHQLLTGFSPLQGLEGTARSLRTRMNALLLDDTSPNGPAGKDGKFTLDELAAAALSNRSLSAELLRADVVKRCQATPSVTLEGQAVDLSKACGVLAAWDGRFDVNSVGAVLWREFTTQYELADTQKAGVLFQQDFNATNAVNTPHTMTPDKNNESLLKLARAVRTLEQAGFAVDAPLGNVQYSDKNGGRIPIHGGGAYEGIANIVSFSGNSPTLEPFASPERVKGSRFLTKEGYLINYGTSFIMALEFTANGPRAQAFLTYSQSGDPTSPQFSDQTQLFSEKKWRRVLYTEAEIKGDPNLKTVKVKSTK